MAISTYKSFLMIKKESTYEKLLNVKDFGDLGGEPEMIETTSLSDKSQTYIPGIQMMDAMNFTANYTKDEYQQIDALKGVEHDLAVWFGGTEAGATVTPTGDQGKFEFKGYISVYVKGGGVNEVVEMIVTVSPSTPITLATA